MEKSKEFVNWILDASFNNFNDGTVEYTKTLLLKTIAGWSTGLGSGWEEPDPLLVHDRWVS